jgi:hypothetical protein
VTLDCRSHAFAAGCGRREGIDPAANCVGNDLDSLVENLSENLLLRLEVIVNTAGLDARRIGHLAQRGRSVTVMAKQACRREQHQLASIGISFGGDRFFANLCGHFLCSR